MEKGVERRVCQQILIAIFPASKQGNNGKGKVMRGQRDVGMAAMALTQRRTVVFVTMVVMVIGGLHIFLALQFVIGTGKYGEGRKKDRDYECEDLHIAKLVIIEMNSFKAFKFEGGQLRGSLFLTLKIILSGFSGQHQKPEKPLTISCPAKGCLSIINRVTREGK